MECSNTYEVYTYVSFNLYLKWHLIYRFVYIT